MIGIEPAELAELIRRAVREAVADASDRESPVSLTLAATMARLDCKRTKVFALLRAGRLKRGQKAGRSPTVTLASIEAFERGEEPPPKPKRQRRRVRGLEARLLAVRPDGGSSR